MSDSFRLSPQQARLWQLAAPARAGAFETAAAVTLRGPLDTGNLRAALGSVVARHEILHTAFPPVTGLSLPLQQILPETEPGWLEVDLSDLDAESRDPRLDELLRGTIEGAGPAADAATGPLLWVALARLGEGEHRLLVRASSLIADAATVKSVIEEMLRTLAGEGSVEAPGDGEDDEDEDDGPMQFADLAEWQIELLESEEMEAGRTFWRQQTVEGLAAHLPYALPEGSEGFAPARIPIPLGEGVGRALDALASAHDLPLDALLAAGFRALVEHSLGESDGVLGWTFDGRSYEELSQAMGPLARVLPLAAGAGPDETLIDLAQRLETLRAELYDWQEYFVWDDLELGPEAGSPPYCSFACDLQRLPEPSSVGGLEVVWHRLEQTLDRYELRLVARRHPEGELELDLGWDTARYQRADIERAAAQLALLLAALADDPSLRVATAPLLTAAERRHLLSELNATERSWPDAPLFHQLFERQVAEHGDQPAVAYEGTVLTHAELDGRANQLAHHLRSLGVGPETVVAFALERSERVIVALLGILKAGGAYLPLDPSLPADRLEGMLDDSGATMVVSEPGSRDALPAEGPPVVDLVADADTLAAASSSADTAPAVATHPAQAAYVLFTSGSTGRPKAVVVEHRQAVSYTRGVMARLDLPAGTHYAVVSTFAADLGNTMIFASLAGGGCLHVISQERLFDPDALAAYLAEHDIATVKIVPSHLEALQGGGELEKVLPGRLLVLGGEGSRRSWVAEMRRRAPGCRILNHYGPTETTVGVLTHAVDEPPTGDDAIALPLGRPLDNVRAYVLDARLEPQPYWVAGELCVAGASLSRGYLHQPAQTAERFLPDPHAEQPGERLYRTGDLARVLPSGTIEFLGRVDDQVKIHGFRIELGEIEVTLAKHPGVRRAVVMARDDDGSGLRIVAYLVPSGSESPGVDALREHLGRTLPEFMMPAAFVPLTELPLNPNGKVDRKRLPAPDVTQMRSRQEYVAPRTKEEQILAELWEEVLGIDAIGIKDNFFHLGGDSIRSIEVRARARRHGLDFSIADVFQHQTIERLAEHLVAGDALEDEVYTRFSLVSETDRERMGETIEDAYPLSMMQQGMLFHSLYSADAATYHDVGSYRFRGIPYDPAAFQRAADTMCARHPALRTAFDYTGFSQPLQLVHRQASMPVESGDWREHPAATDEAAWDEWVDVETHNTFEWKDAPLLRTFLHQLPEGGLQITISFHHAILDGWSRHSMVTELIREYLKEMGHEVPDLPPQPDLSYGEFVGLERQAVASEEVRAFWGDLLEGSERLMLPRLPGAGVEGESLLAKVHINNLPTDLSDRLHQLARHLGVPIKTVLLAASMQGLGLMSGRRDVMTGLVTNGRPEKDAGDRIFGLFLNTVPLRLQLEGGTWSDLIRRSFEAEAAVLPHRRYPLAELQRNFGGGEPLYETAFNYMHYHIYRRVLELSDVEVLGYKGFEETNLTCVTNFHQDPTTHDVQLGIEYHAAILGEAQVERMSRLIVNICQAMVDNLDARYENFSPLSLAERRQILEWNDSAADYGAPCRIEELVAAQARKTPERLALVTDDAELSYGEMLDRIHQLAHHLRALGVGPEVRVAIVAERSIEMVVAMLGVLAAGGAYVPIDPHLPEARIRFMLEDTAARAVLTLDRLRGVVGEELPACVLEVIALDSGWEAVAERPTTAPPADSAIENAAYIIYTSGSTGQPKGVVNGHRGVVNRLRWGQATFGLEPDDRVLQKTPYSFDVSIWEFFWPLMVGARLVLARPGGEREGDYLAKTIARQGITVLHFVPSMLRVFLEQPGVEEQCETVRLVMASGEALPFELVEGCERRIGAPIHNLYGPTEASIEVTHWPGRSDGIPGLVPIGRPVGNLRTFIANHHMQLSPQGVPGELLLGGVGVVRGYHHRPGLSAERFIPDDFSGEPGARLYRTGDLARFLPDGQVEYLGRLDHQVKVRGFRVELGEIESRLRRQKGVSDAVVLARPTGGEPTLVAYWVASEGASPEVETLRDALRAELPAYMVPSLFVVLDVLPLTGSGKVDRRALPDPGEQRQVEVAYQAPRSELERRIAAIWQEVLELDQVSAGENFFDLGGHSLHMVRVQTKLRELMGRDVPMVDLFHYPNVRSLAEHLSGGAEVLSVDRAEIRRRSRAGGDEIAVVGMDGRFPGAPDLDTFWSNIRSGVESVVPISDDELRAHGIPAALIDHPQYIKAKGVLADVDQFDAGFFAYSPLEATIMDPQQRIFLEVAWHALESAGHDPARFPGSVGVYAGIGMNTYAFDLYADRQLVESIGGYQAMISNDKDFLSPRVSYKLDLHGPSVTVQSACSTSLVAIHLACQSLLAGECDMALAGGVRVSVPQKEGYLHQEGGIHSPDGHCRPFDAKSGGTVRGDGAGVVVLRRLEDALADGDTIRAVIKGSAVNNDGARRVGFTAPGVEGQAKVIGEALDVAGVEPDTIGYVDGHGTATELGDPIEIAALTQAYRAAGATGRQRVGIGSTKSNIGHLDAAAGVAGVIKTVLALEHGEMPPSLHFESPNPAIDFASSPFFVNAELRPWPRHGAPRRAGVSSMGIGGTNAHVVLEEAPEPAPAGPACSHQLLVLSARSRAALDTATDALRRHLEAHPELPLADVAHTLRVGRKAFGERRVLVASDRASALEALAGRDPRRLPSASAGDTPEVVFLFPGQGAQYPGMGADLYHQEPAYRRALDQCCDLLEPLLGRDLRQLLIEVPSEGQVAENAAAELELTEVAQPALFAVEYALAETLRAWGIEPAAMIGHSLGELVAATLAGVFLLADALALVAARGRLMAGMPGGDMLSVELSAAEIEPRLAALDSGDALALAAINAPGLSVVSGSAVAIDALAKALAADGVEHRRLHTSHAFHSALVEPAVAPFVEKVASVERHAPRRPFISNVTGDWITDDEATDPEYWGRHLRSTVRFAEGLGTLLAEPGRVLLEVGPGRTLATFAQKNDARSEGQAILGTLRHPKKQIHDVEFLLETIGRAWLAGVEVDWHGFAKEEERRRLPLPGYPFEHQRYWIDRQSTAVMMAAGDRPLADWFFEPWWQRTDLPEPAHPQTGTETDAQTDAQTENVLLLDDGSPLAEALAEGLGAAGRRIARARVGDGFEDHGEGRYTLDPGSEADYLALFDALGEAEREPDRIVHLWSQGLDHDASFDQQQRLGMLSVVRLAQALETRRPGVPARIDVVSGGLAAVTDDESVMPARAALLGPLRVIPQEVSNLTLRAIDLGLAVPRGGRALARCAERLLAELAGPGEEILVAYRGNQRWVEELRPRHLGEAGPGTPGLGDGDVVLLNGVFGADGEPSDEGLAFAELLAGAGAHLVVPCPDGASSPRLDALQQAQEKAGRSLWLRPVETTDVGALGGLIGEARSHFGRLDAVVHREAPGSGLEPLGELDPAALGRAASAAASRLGALERALEGEAGEGLKASLVLASNAGLVGGVGLTGTAATAAWLAASGDQGWRHGTLPWRAICWDYHPAEQDGAHAATLGSREGGGHTMGPDEGAEVLRRLLAHPDTGRIAVATVDLAALERSWRHTGDSGPAAGGVQHARPELGVDYVAPRDETEQEIATIWQELLGLERVGIYDDFFELGGHSLLATRVVSRLRQSFNVSLPLRSLFDASTVADLAEQVVAKQLESTDQDALAQMLDEVADLSEDELAALLADEGPEK